VDGFPFESAIHDELLERRQRIEDLRAFDGDFEFINLLGQIDTALEKIDNGTYGQCEQCDGYVEPERLLADPLVRVCLGELTDQQRQALEDDLQLASVIQRGLLPSTASVNGSWKADFIYQPLGPVSGDYCDIIQAGDELYFVLGDVSGKGMAASLLMSSLHAIFHTLIPLGIDLKQIMTRANALLVESSLSNQFATLVLGKADLSGNVEIVNAGHLPPLVIKNGMMGELNHAGLPLGMFHETQFSISEVELNAGDSLLLFTDGVTECTNAAGAELGTCGLIDALGGGNWTDPASLISHCLETVEGHRGQAERFDDLTILALTHA